MTLTANIPSNVYLAFSGGHDSSAALGFLLRGRRNVHLLHFHHGTPYCDAAQAHCETVAKSLGIPITVGKIRTPVTKSKEEAWRSARYDFFGRFLDKPIVVAHHLDDCVETYVFSCLHGHPKTIPAFRSPNIIRPFLAMNRERLRSFTITNPITDPSNTDEVFKRAHIRSLMPELVKVNPGLRTTVKNMVLRRIHDDQP